MSNSPTELFVEAHTAHKFIDRTIDDDTALHELLQALSRHGRWKTNFLAYLGFASLDGHRPRGPRLEFDQAVRFG